MIYGQNPKYYNNPCSCSQAPKFITIQNECLVTNIGEGSQTRAMSARTLQAYGNGKGAPLTGNAEGEKIVETL